MVSKLAVLAAVLDSTCKDPAQRSNLIFVRMSNPKGFYAGGAGCHVGQHLQGPSHKEKLDICRI